MRKRGILISIIGILLVSSLLLILISKNTKKYIMQDGTMLALTLDGKNITSFPSGDEYHVDIECTGGVGKYQPVRTLDSNGVETDTYEMKFTIEKTKETKVKCDINFYTITEENKNNYLITTEVQNKGTQITSTNNNGNTDISYRYQGKQPNNWVWFNNELWRIIGSIPTCMDSGCTTKTNLVKIMRAESIGGLSYDANFTNATWGTNTLYTLLNTYYYGRQDATGARPCSGYATGEYSLCNYTNKGISNDNNDYYGRMVENVYMNAGTVSSISTNINTAYTFETATLTSKTAHVGLMTSSDYGYATSGITYSSVGLISLSSYEQNNWIYRHNREWTMTNASSVYVMFVAFNGYVTYDDMRYGNDVRPAVYLNYSTYIISGDGTESNPYILGM